MRYVTELQHAVEAHENLWIPMSDGVDLACRLWLPGHADDEHPVPAVVEYIPYRKRDMTRARDTMMHPYFAGHGYAAVRVDLRGSGDSGGVLTDEYLLQEQEDGLEVLSWLADQPWCDGTIGMIGKSWGGFNALQLAARRPPELGAIIAVCATDDRYVDDVHYMGGCLLGDNLSWASVMFAFNSCPPDPEIVGDRWRDLWLERLENSGLWVHEWLQHQRRDEYWRHGSVCEDLSAIQCPVMIVSGWADGYSNAVLRLLEGLEVPCRGLIGPWSHRYPHQGVPGPAIDFLGEAVRWWDQWLRGRDVGIEQEPVLRAWMQDSVAPTTQYDYRPGRWVTEAVWPSPEIVEQCYQLAPLRLVASEQRGEAGETPGWDAAEGVELTVQSPLSVGLFAGKWCSYSATPDLPHDQRQEDGGALTFDSEPLEEDLQILGAPVVELELASSEPVAMVAVRLSDMAPDDKVTRVTYGLLNLTHRDSHEEPSELEVDRWYRVAVQLNDVGQVFPAGHRLRIAISTSYWPLAWVPPRPARLGIRTGASALRLPVRPPRAEAEDVRPFDSPKAAPPLAVDQLGVPHHTWRVVRDLATDESSLEVIKDEGVERIEELDLEIINDTRERYTFVADDFTSVRGEVVGRRGFRRGDWKVETVTRTDLRCNETEFRIHADLDAYEGDHRFYANSWDVVVPRDHM